MACEDGRATSLRINPGSKIRPLRTHPDPIVGIFPCAGRPLLADKASLVGKVGAAEQLPLIAKLVLLADYTSVPAQPSPRSSGPAKRLPKASSALGLFGLVILPIRGNFYFFYCTQNLFSGHFKGAFVIVGRRSDTEAKDFYNMEPGCRHL